MPTPDWNKKYCAGKGDWRRPEDRKKFRDNFDRIFRKPEPSCTRCQHYNQAADWCGHEHRDIFDGEPDFPCGGELFKEDTT